MDPRNQTVTIPLNLGIDNVSLDESVQPAGPKPRFVSSRNTRLTKVPGLVSKAPKCTRLATLTADETGGAIPVGSTDSTVIPRRKYDSTRRVAGDGIGALRGLHPDYPQSAYYPAQVTSAGVLQGGSNGRWNPSVCRVASTGLTYFVNLRPQLSGGAGVYLTVMDDDGVSVIRDAFLVQVGEPVASERNVASVTCHGSTVVLWYGEGGNTQLFASTITVNESTLSVTVGAQNLIHTYAAALLGPKSCQIGWDPADSTQAFVITRGSVVDTDTELLKVTLPSFAVTSLYTIPTAANEWMGICYRSGVGLIGAVSSAAGNTYVFEFNPAGPSLTWSQSGLMDGGQPHCGFETYQGVVYRVFAVSALDYAYGSTRVQWRTSAGALFLSGFINRMSMVGHLVTQKSTLTNEYGCVYVLQPVYDVLNAPDSSYDATGGYFVPDPAITLARVTPTVLPTGGTILITFPVAKLGSDTCVRYPGGINRYAYGTSNPPLIFTASSSNCIDVGDRVLVTYLAENVEEGNVSIGYVSRYAWVDFGSTQPRFAHTSDGTAVIAGALPAIWDGSEVAEYGPLHIPVLSGVGAGGSGVALPGPGTYLFFEVVSWKDAQGVLHRSAPSTAVELTGAALQPILSVSCPVTYRNGAQQYAFQAVIYASEMNGVVAYAQDYWLDVYATADTTSATISMTDIRDPVVDAFHPAIYTDGSATQELAAFCPNACVDVAVIGDRLWMLDAERPIWWFSKPKAEGYFFEMSPDLFVVAPSSAGAGVATAEWLGNPLLMTTRGIWTVGGEGPDALNQPPFFSSPQQVSDVACTQRLSVLRTPVGVMFIAANRFKRFAGQVFDYDDVNATLYGDVVGTAIFREQHEACFFLENGYVYVFNWQRDTFTVWDNTVTGTSSLTGAAQRADGKVVLVSTTGVWLLDPNDVSTTAQMSIETGWIQLGGPQDNNTIRDLVLHARRAAAHGVTAEIYVDYNDTTLVTKTYDQTEVLLSSQDAAFSMRYDLFLQLASMPARAVKIRLTETAATGDAFQPIHLLIEFQKHQGKRDAAYLPAGRK